MSGVWGHASLSLMVGWNVWADVFGSDCTARWAGLGAELYWTVLATFVAGIAASSPASAEEGAGGLPGPGPIASASASMTS